MIVPFEKKIIEPNGKGLWFPGKPVHFNFSAAALLISGCGCCASLTPRASVWKLNSNLQLMWRRDTGGVVYDVAVDGSNNVYVCGERIGNKTVWKYDTNGNLLWSYDMGHTTMSILADGDYIYIGCVYDVGVENYTLLKLKPGFMPEWFFYTAPVGTDGVYGIYKSGSSIYIACGARVADDACLIELADSDGSENWVWADGDAFNPSAAIGLDVKFDGTYVYLSGVSPIGDGYVWKIEPGGTPEKKWQSADYTTCQHIALDEANDIFVAIADGVADIRKLDNSDGTSLWSWLGVGGGWGVIWKNATKTYLSAGIIYELDPTNGSNPVNIFNPSDPGVNLTYGMDIDSNNNIVFGGERVDYF